GVGHGSRRDPATATVRELARPLADPGGAPQWAAGEASVLEIVEPSVAAGYSALADAGCTEIVVHPFFLFAGNHTNRDIPAELTSAQRDHPGTRWTMTEPLGLHPGVVAAARARIEAVSTAPLADLGG
nr:CbiX/SirB N-terminal domain-containing protein [Micromonospora sp. DSM 115978]